MGLILEGSSFFQHLSPMWVSATGCRTLSPRYYCLKCQYIRYASTKTPPIASSPIARHGFLYCWDTIPPTKEQLKRGERFFQSGPPKFIDSALKFWNVKETSLPEVAFIGRSNVGKSSLLNALMGEKLCHTSSRPGRTRSMNFFAAGGQDHIGNIGRMVLLDMPGYGKGSHEEWGKEIIKYLARRRQ